MDSRPSKPELFRAIDVWQRNSDNELVRFRCFQSLSTGKYSVQSEDYYHLPVDPKQVSTLDGQFLELLFEQLPAERSAEYDSLADAIAAHVNSFVEFWPEDQPNGSGK